MVSEPLRRVESIWRKIMNKINFNILLIKYSKKHAEQILRYLIEFVTDSNYANYLINPSLTEQQLNKLNNLIKEHIEENRPIQYIIGNTDFLDLKIKVKEPILIPRSETEEWVNNLLNKFKNFENHKLKIVDIGTGTGCIAIALAKFFKNSEIFAIDINPVALELAQENAELNKIKNIKFVESDLFSNFDEKVDIIVSNPPYISLKDYENLDASVKSWEDKTALTAEDDGLFIIKKIIEESKNYLLKDSILKNLPRIYIEIDAFQAKKVLEILAKNGFNGEVLKDYAGKDRVTIAFVK